MVYGLSIPKMGSDTKLPLARQRGMGGGVIKLKGPLAAPGMFAYYFFFSDSGVGRDGYRRIALPAQI